MNKILISILLFFVFFFVILTAISAQEYQSKKVVVLSKDKIIDNNYFAAGESVTVSGTVNGDAYVAGGNLLVDGTINGDLLIAGGTVTISGIISQDLRVAGGQINIEGTINGNITVTGGTIIVSNSAVINGSLVAAGGQISVLAPIEKSVTIGGGQVTLSNIINGDVMAGVGQLTLTPNSRINGNLTYYSEENVQMLSGASVSGLIKKETPPIKEQQAHQTSKMVAKAISGIALGFTIISFVAAFIVGLLLVNIVPVFMQKTVKYIHIKPWSSLGFGALILFLSPILFVMMILTLIGAPLALVLLTLYGIIIYFAKIIVALFIGQWIQKILNNKQTLVMGLFIGLLGYYLLSFIPILGFMIQGIFLLSGIGALVLSKKEMYTFLRTKKYI